jgi:hypothetical protein
MLIARPRPRSLADEPLAAAMRALPPMAAGTRELVRERLWMLTSADRGECVDFTFGDSEIYWYTPGAKSSRPLAEGYYGREISVTLFDRLGDPLVEWEETVAWSLLALGRLVGRERNDEAVDLDALDELYLAEREV